MALRLFVITLILLAPNNLAGASRATLRVQVTDDTGAAVTSALVFVHREPNNGESDSVSTNALRRLSFQQTTVSFYGEVDPGVYDIFITGRGFNPACSKRRLDPSSSQTLDIVLHTNTIVYLHP